MAKTIMLLRGINVGGHNKLRMADLRALLEGLGLQDVKTYIQSGNVVFQDNGRDPDQLQEEIASAIETQHGFKPRILLISEEAFMAAMEGSPYPQGESEPKKVNLFFLAQTAENADLEKLNALKKETEQFKLGEKVFYLYTPDGFGRSKVAEKAERLLGVPTTARNWRTVTKISEMIGRG